MHCRGTATNKETFSPNSSIPPCPFPNHIPSGKTTTKKILLFHFGFLKFLPSGSRRENTAPGLQQEGLCTPLRRFIQRGFFKPF